MITALSIGYQRIEVGAINNAQFQDMVAGGLPELVEVPVDNLYYGLTGFGVFGPWVAGFELGGNQSTIRGDISRLSRSEGRGRGLTVILYTGRHILRTDRWSAFPLMGLGMASNTLNYRFTPDDPNQIPGQDIQSRRLSLTNDHLLLDLGGSIHRFFQFAKQRNYAATIGLRFGYQWQLASFNARSRLAGQVAEAPRFGHSGWYLKLVLGGGLWDNGSD